MARQHDVARTQPVLDRPQHIVVQAAQHGQQEHTEDTNPGDVVGGERGTVGAALGKHGAMGVEVETSGDWALGGCCGGLRGGCDGFGFEISCGRGRGVGDGRG